MSLAERNRCGHCSGTPIRSGGGASSGHGAEVLSIVAPLIAAEVEYARADSSPGGSPIPIPSPMLSSSSPRTVPAKSPKGTREHTGRQATVS